MLKTTKSPHNEHFPYEVLVSNLKYRMTMEVTKFFTDLLDKYQFEEGQWEKINKKNAIAVFPRLQSCLSKKKKDF